MAHLIDWDELNVTKFADENKLAAGLAAKSQLSDEERRDINQNAD